MDAVELVSFEDIQAKVVESKRQAMTRPDPRVVSIANRLLSPDFHDPVEMQIRLLGELQYRCYAHILSLPENHE